MGEAARRSCQIDMFEDLIGPTIYAFVGLGADIETSFEYKGELFISVYCLQCKIIQKHVRGKLCSFSDDLNSFA